MGLMAVLPASTAVASLAGLEIQDRRMVGRLGAWWFQNNDLPDHIHLLLCNHLFRIPLANPALSIYMPHKPSHSFFSGLDLINILPEYQRLSRSSLEHPLRWLHRNQPPARAAVPFHPPCAETSGRIARTIGHRSDTIHLR